VQSSRSWNPRQLQRLVDWAENNGLALKEGTGTAIRLTDAGIKAARRLVRNHRLWELYLIQYADIAAAHVDHTADLIEHVVDAETVEELEKLLEKRERGDEVPESPHVIGNRQ
jgi:manganese/zinc/iron transport system permease protein